MLILRNIIPLLVWLLLPFDAGITRAETAPTNTPWSQIMMIGASASAGFMMSEPFGGTNTLKCRLSYYIDAAIKPSHPPVKNLSHAMFFMNPEVTGRLQVARALTNQPTLVLGVDFLFWFCYGQGRTDAERLERFENGLKLLDSIQCPLVLGDIPDASYATNTGIISSDQVPSNTARTAANHRLKEWAANHPQVAIVPLADFMRTALANEALAVHGQTLRAGKSRAILQDDQLHPNPQGATLLALGILDALTLKQPRFSTNDVRWKLEEVFNIGYEAAQPAPRPSTNQSPVPGSPIK